MTGNKLLNKLFGTKETPAAGIAFIPSGTFTLSEPINVSGSISEASTVDWNTFPSYDIFTDASIKLADTENNSLWTIVNQTWQPVEKAQSATPTPYKDRIDKLRKELGL